MHTPPPQPEDARPGRPDEPRAPDPAPPDRPAGDATDLFRQGADPSDDTPTVISRMPPRPTASGDVFGGTLRGRRLAHFELIEPIGVGGMAAVIRARDLQLERQVALKILPPEMAADPENVRRFHLEARAAARLDHENIARVFFCGEDQKLHFIAFEFVEGQNLRALIERRGRLPVSEAIHYMLQIATGLAHAAERGVIHRDIKPSNIIISPNGRAKLVDMGLARQTGPHLDQGLTQSGVTLGTFDYISPEQALEPRDADARSDIYSLGCTFYHALTGQPPVPEGTAAKKLHHHQHVAPLDPRQINPDIPDDVAAILGRMMAKDVQDRYQRPEHLVQHLLLVAQKLGVSADVPEGLLFVDAALPSPPRPRPLLWLLVGTAAVVALVVLLGQAPRASNSTTQPLAVANGEPQAEPPNAAATAPKKPTEATSNAATQNDEANGGTPAPPASPPPVYDASPPVAKDIQDFLGRPSQPGQTKRIVEVSGTLDLGKNLGPTGPGLVFNGGADTLIIRPKDPSQRPVIRIRPEENNPSSLWAALQVQGGKVELHGLRFELYGNLAPALTMAALYCQAGHIEVENCEFVQAQPPDPENSRVSALEVAGPGAGERPTVTFSRCCFRRASQESASLAGQNVITLTAPGTVQLNDCAFGPHAAVVSFLGAGADPGLGDARAVLTHCTALLGGDAAVVRLENASPARVEASNCIFSAPDSEDPEAAPPKCLLVRQANGGSEALAWVGRANRYYNLTAFWQQGPDTLAPGLDQFRDEVKSNSGKEDGSLVLGAAPSASENPLKLLDDPDQLAEAFKPDPRLADLWEKDGGKDRLAGVDHVLDVVAYGENLHRPTRRPGPAVAANVKVVEPPPPGKPAIPGTYPDLAAAMSAARPGDVIELRFNGPQPMDETVRLDRPNLADLTIRAASGYRPVLVLTGANPEDKDAGLFRVYDGKLRLEQVQFQVRAPAVAAAVLVGDGSCSFSDCVLTLEQTNVARLAAVAVTNLPAAMEDNRMTRPAGQRATASFKNCVVRGDGDLIADGSGRPVTAEADNALLALGGSVLNLESTDDMPANAPGASAALKLTRVTAYLGGNLIHFSAGKDVRGLVPVQVSPSNCLFLAPAGTGMAMGGSKPLILLDGPDTSEDRMKQLLQWSGQANAYNNFSPMLDQKSGSGEMPAMMPFTKDRWKELTGESNAAFDRVKLVEGPGPDFVPSRATPAQFRVKPDPDQPAYGADLEALARLFPAEGTSRADR
jgi:serine/threonine protein kinase